MERFSPRFLKDSAADALQAASYPPRKLVLLHTGATLLVSLLLTVVHYLLSAQIGTTGGLAGIGTRTLLTSAQTFLQIAVTVALPFWEMGFLFCVIRFARRQSAALADLTQGFRRFAPLLRLTILEFLLYGVLMFVSIQLMAILFSLTPFALPVMDQLSRLMQSEAFMQSGTVPQDFIDQLLPYLIPVYLCAVILFFAAAIPIFYRFRFSRFAIMDNKAPGALAALRFSTRLAKGHCMQLFRLDLSYWWYYVLQLLVAAAAYADLLLPVLGISLQKEIAFFGTLALHLVLSLALAWYCRAQVDTTYACFYLQLLPPEKPELPQQETKW